jgi:phage-related protein
LKRQRELGAYTKEDAEQSKKFKQSLADLLAAWDGFTSFIGRFTVPIMRVLADALTAVVVFMRQHTPFVVAAITMIGAALAVRLLPPLRTLPGLIANVGKAFLRWLPFVAVITAIALLIEDFWVYLQGGESELAEFWAIFGTGPEIMAKLNSAWKETKEYLAAIGTGLAQMVRYWYDLMQASGMFAALGQTFKGLLQILKGIFTLDWSLLGEGLSNVLNGMVRGVASTFKGLGILVRDAVQAIFQGLISSVPGFSSWAMGIAETLKGIFRLDPGMILDGLKNVFDGAGTMIASGVKGWLTICANAWSAIIEVFTGTKIDLSGMLDQLWNSITETCNKIKEWVVNWISNLFSGIKLPSISDLFGGAGDLAKGAGDALGSAASGALKLGQEAGSALKEGLGKVGDFFGGLFADAGPKTEEAGAKVQDGMAQTAGAVRDGFNAAWNATRDFAVTQFQGAATTIQSIFAGIVAGIEGQVGALVAGAQRMAGEAGGMIPAAAGVRAQAGGNRSSTFNQQNRITIHAPGGDPRAVQQGVQRGLSQSNKTMPAQSGTVVK